MDRFPQLRVRTEFSFPRRVYGPLGRVVERLTELKTHAAGVVNAGGGTWGHPKFEKKALAAGIEPMFGAEFLVERGEAKPTAWVLGDPKGSLYAWASRGSTLAVEDFAKMGPDVVRFAGAALEDPATFDYVDVSPRSPLAQRRALTLAEQTGKPLALVADNFCPAPEDLGLMRATIDREGTGVQWLANPDELRAAMPLLTDAQFAAAVRGAHEVAERLRGSRLRKAPLIHLEGDLRALCEEGMRYRIENGHIAAWTEAYAQRLERELELIRLKRYESYFLMVSDLVRWAKARMLVGPARGSSAGSLVCYLTRITEIDPLRHDLLFERFIDVNRNDLPDIDIDFSDVRRDLVFEYLADKYGQDHVARLGNINTFKPNSVIAQLGKRLGVPIGDTFSIKNVLVEYSSGDSRYGHALEDTLRDTSAGQKFAEAHPEFVSLTNIEGHATHTGVHAAGVVVCNEPITNFCTVVGGVAQVDKPDAEYLNLLKIDALGLRTLGILEDAGVAIAEDLYALDLKDEKVFEIFNQRKMAGIFQFEGAAQRSVASQIQFSSFTQLDHVTALARPGPLGGGAANHYIRRAAGAEQVEYRHPTMEAYLGETLGVVLYQEQVMRISREIGGMSWEVVSEIRKAMSGRKGKEYFDQRGTEFRQGAAKMGLSNDEAQTIWDEICNFGAWGMNKSHTVSYAVISYWCAWMKRYHPLEFAAATLRSAKSDDQAQDLLREMIKEGVDYVPLDPELSESDWSVQNGKLIGGLQNAIGFGPAKASAYIEARKEGRLTDKQRDALRSAEVKFKDLFAIHTAYGDWYENPQNHNIRAGWRVKELADLQEGEEAVVICKLLKKEQRDENENLRVKRRGGRKLSGNTVFADLKMVDDSTSMPLTVRIDRFSWHRYGIKIMDGAVEGKDCFLIRGQKVPNFPMLKVDKIQCLTNPELTS